MSEISFMSFKPQIFVLKLTLLLEHLSNECQLLKTSHLYQALLL